MSHWSIYTLSINGYKNKCAFFFNSLQPDGYNAQLVLSKGKVSVTMFALPPLPPFYSSVTLTNNETTLHVSTQIDAEESPQKFSSSLEFPRKVKQGSDLRKASELKKIKYWSIILSTESGQSTWTKFAILYDPRLIHIVTYNVAPFKNPIVFLYPWYSSQRLYIPY